MSKSTNSIAKPIFLCGCHRTGTTLLQEVLSQHRAVDILPETKLFAWQYSPLGSAATKDPVKTWHSISTLMPFINRAWGQPQNAERLRRLRRCGAPSDISSIGDLMEHLLTHCAGLQNESRVGEKSPLHIYHVDAILKQFPDAKIVISQRDLRGAWLSQFNRVKKRLSYRRFNPQTFVAAWLTAYDQTKRLCDRFSKSVRVIKFENLVIDPSSTLKSLCDFLELHFDPKMLDTRFQNSSFDDIDNGIQSASANRWREELSKTDRRLLESIATKELVELGYLQDEKRPKATSDSCQPLKVRIARNLCERNPPLFCYFGRDKRYRRFQKLLKKNVIPATDPKVIVLGNHKSGTTAIARLLAELCDISCSIDIPRQWRRSGYAMIRGTMTFDEFTFRHSALFQHDLVKIPAMTFVSEQVINRFPASKIVFVIRDPRDNIRSLLNRRKIPGDLQTIPRTRSWWNSWNQSPSWDSQIWGGDHDGYVGVLAHRWNAAIENLERIREFAEVIRYEDFVADKMETLVDLASKIELDPTASIADRLDINFQPPGDRTIGHFEFFGEQNLTTINTICAEYMERFGY